MTEMGTHDQMISPGREIVRILWVSYIFPPYGGTQGVWMQKYIEHLAHSYDKRVHFDILTVTPSRRYPQYDPGLLESIDDDSVTIHRIVPDILNLIPQPEHSGRLYGAFKSMAAFMGNFLWFSSACLWLIKRSFSNRERFDGIYVFVDPFPSILIGTAARLLFKCKLIVEYGDPWRIKPATLKRSALMKGVGGLIERRSLGHADRIITQTRNVSTEYSKLYAGISPERFIELYGGVEWDEYDRAEAFPDTGKFVICHTGTFYKDTIDYRPFLEAFKGFVDDGKPVELVMLGDINGSFKADVEGMGLSKHVSFHGHLPFAEVIRHQKSSSLLLAFSVATPFKIPSKIGQYIASRKPILVIKDIEDDPSAAFVTERRRGIAVQNSSVAIGGAIDDLYRYWSSDEYDEHFDFSTLESISYSRIANEIKDTFEN